MATKAIPVVAAKVAATLSDYPALIIPSEMTGWGAITLAEAQSIRFYSDSGLTTELAREVVSADEIHVKVPSLTTTTTIYADYDGIRADYAVGATYGRNAVWSGYDAVYHLESGGTDSTGNIDLTNTGVTFAAGKIGDSAAYNSTADRLSTGTAGVLDLDIDEAFTIQAWVNVNNLTAARDVFSHENPSSPFNGYRWRIFDSAGTYKSRIQLGANNGGSNTIYVDTTGAILPTANNWHSIALTFSGNSNASGMTFYSNGSSPGQTILINTATADPTYSGNFALGNNVSFNQNFDGEMDEVRKSPTQFSANRITTEYNNQSDVGTFWGTVTDLASNEAKSIAGVSNV